MTTNHAEREISREQLTHKIKLQTIKSRIDNRPPRSHSHVRANQKKELQKKQRQNEIQGHNRKLLERLMRIESKPLIIEKQPSLKSNKNSKLDMRVALENPGILHRIKSAKSYYSSQKFKEEYEFQQYLKAKLSENARRVPKTTYLQSAEVSRPSTAK